MHFWFLTWSLYRSGASWHAPQGLRRDIRYTISESNVTRLVVGGPSPRGEPSAGSLRV